MSSHRIVGSANEELVIQSSLSGIQVQYERVFLIARTMMRN